MEVSIPPSAPNAFRLAEDGLPPLHAHQFLSLPTLLLSGKLDRRRCLLAASLALCRVPRSSFACTTPLPSPSLVVVFQFSWTQKVRCFQVLSEDVRIRDAHIIRVPRRHVHFLGSWRSGLACLMVTGRTHAHHTTSDQAQHAAASFKSHFDGNSIL